MLRFVLQVLLFEVGQLKLIGTSFRPKSKIKAGQKFWRLQLRYSFRTQNGHRNTPQVPQLSRT